MSINTDLILQMLAGGQPQGNPMGINVQPPPQGIGQRLGQMGQNFTSAGGINALMGNPLFGMGMGLLSSAQGGNPWQGALAGMYGSQLFKQRQQQFDLEAQQAKAERERLKNITMLAQEGLKTIDVDGDGNISPAEQARAEYLKGAATTGDATLLAEANKTLQSLQTKPTSLQQNLGLAGLVEGTPEYQQAALAYVTKPQTQINMGAIAKPVGADAINWRMPDGSQPNPMLTPEQIAGAGGQPISPEQRRPPTAEEAAKTSAAEDSITMLDRLDELVTSGAVPVGPGPDVWRSMRNPLEDAGVGRKLGAEALGKAYPISQPEAEAIALSEKLSTVLLQAIRGAQVGPMEQAKFEKQLPRLGQPESVFKENLELTRKNLEYLTKRRAELRSGAVPPPAIANPEAPVVDWSDLQ